MEIEEIREKLQGKTFYVWNAETYLPERIIKCVPQIRPIDKSDYWSIDFYYRDNRELTRWYSNEFKTEYVDLLIQGATISFNRNYFKTSFYKENALGDIKPRAIEHLNDEYEKAKAEIDDKDWDLYRWQAACHIMGHMMQHSIVSKYTQDVASGAVEAADMLIRSYKELLYDEAKARIKKEIDKQNLLNL